MTRNPALEKSKRDGFVSGYIEAMLWSSNDESDEYGGKPLDANYSARDIEAKSLKKIKADCAKFIKANKKDIEEYVSQRHTVGSSHYADWSSAGHDFWLTRNHHGAGFWDRGVGDVGDRLTEASQKFGECYPYVQNGKVGVD